MPKPRKLQISLSDTPYYHCISRCVRHAFLCGEDEFTGKSYEHRRKWIEDKLLLLPAIFAIDVCSYSVMSNHTHVVLHVAPTQTECWTTKDILSRWHRLFKGTLLTQKYMNEEKLSESEHLTVKQTTAVYKQRLMDISWFMRVLNEGIAREANKEDKVTGRFWEGRFKSQALLDEAALLSCMAYVDLNPIRANIAKTPETSDYTSIKRRIKQVLNIENNTACNSGFQGVKQPKSLMPFVGELTQQNVKGLPFSLKDYIELVDMTGRSIREDKRGYIANQLPAILNRLHISEESWLTVTTQFEEVFHGAVGHPDSIAEYSNHRQLKRRQNLTNCEKLFA
jgi:REP element-mobilizing transposase RayT